MKVCFYPELTLGSDARPVVTLGNFDGVHLGHQRIMKLLAKRGAALHLPTVAVTFEPHPISVLRPEVAPKRILTPDQKREVLGKMGIDLLWVIEFTLEFSRTDPKEFIREVLFEGLHASELVLGTNFRFGHGRAGDLETLKSLGSSFGFDVRRVDPALSDGEMISSSRIRKALTEGMVTAAAVMLGRPYFLDGSVVHGDGRGKAMGFPTANVDVVGDVLLADGVYATSARLDGRVYRGMAHVGKRRWRLTSSNSPRRFTRGRCVYCFTNDCATRSLSMGQMLCENSSSKIETRPGRSSVARVVALCYKKRYRGRSDDGERAPG